MKTNISILTLLLFFSLSAIQGAEKSGSNIYERIYISTDKGSYVAGDDIFCSLFCFEVSPEGAILSSFSSIAYIEISSSEGVCASVKAALYEGLGAGTIRLSPDLPTGNYKISAYTTQNRNEEGFIPVGKYISIYNPISSERIKGGVEVTEEAIAEGEKLTVSEEVSISLPNMKTLSSAPVFITNDSDEAMTLSVSIYHCDALTGNNLAYNITSFEEEMKKISFGEVSDTFIPEYEGQVIRVKSDAKGKNMFLSFIGKENQCYIANVDSTGYATFFTDNIYGDKDVVLEILPGYTDRNQKSEIISPYIGKYDYDYPVLKINPGMEKDLLLRSISMQTNRRFGGDTLNNELFRRADSFLGIPQNSYFLDDYTRFPTMNEVLTEYVAEIRPRRTDGKADIRVVNDRGVLGSNVHFSKASSLVLLDGIPVNNHQKILDYDPLNVRKISVYSDNYIISNILYEGVVCFETYKGTMPFFTLDSTAVVSRYHGAMLPYSFTGKQFVNNTEYPDYRQTLYWNPSVRISSGEKFTLDCVTPKYSGDFIMVVEGITASGKTIYSEKKFKVQ